MCGGAGSISSGNADPNVWTKKRLETSPVRRIRIRTIIRIRTTEEQQEQEQQEKEQLTENIVSPSVLDRLISVSH